MNDVDLDELTLDELFYLKDEWNLAYKKLLAEYSELETIHQTLDKEFLKRGVEWGTNETDNLKLENDTILH